MIKFYDMNTTNNLNSFPFEFLYLMELEPKFILREYLRRKLELKLEMIASIVKSRDMLISRRT